MIAARQRLGAAKVPVVAALLGCCVVAASAASSIPISGGASGPIIGFRQVVCVDNCPGHAFALNCTTAHFRIGDCVPTASPEVFALVLGCDDEPQRRIPPHVRLRYVTVPPEHRNESHVCDHGNTSRLVKEAANVCFPVKGPAAHPHPDAGPHPLQLRWSSRHRDAARRRQPFGLDVDAPSLLVLSGAFSGVNEASPLFAENFCDRDV